MPRAKRQRREPTDDWHQLQLLTQSPVWLWATVSRLTRYKEGHGDLASGTAEEGRAAWTEPT